MYMETMGYKFEYVDLDMIKKMGRHDLEQWLESRGMAVYDDDTTRELRETAIDDYENEMQDFQG